MPSSISGAVERPAGPARPGRNLRDQPSGQHPSRHDGARRRRGALRLHVLVQRLRCRHRRDRRRVVGDQSADRLCPLQGARRGRPHPHGERHLPSDDASQRHRIRCEPPATIRRRSQQPDGRRVDDRGGEDAVRRNALATTRTHPRHHRRGRGGASCTGRGDPRADLNVGSDDQNYRIREIAEIVAETVPGATASFGLRRVTTAATA